MLRTAIVFHATIKLSLTMQCEWRGKSYLTEKHSCQNCFIRTQCLRKILRSTTDKNMETRFFCSISTLASSKYIIDAKSIGTRSTTYMSGFAFFSSCLKLKLLVLQQRGLRGSGTYSFCQKKKKKKKKKKENEIFAKP